MDLWNIIHGVATLPRSPVRPSPITILHGTSTVLNDIGLESTLFDGAAAEQPPAVHVVSVRLRYVVHAGV